MLDNLEFSLRNRKVNLKNFVLADLKSKVNRDFTIVNNNCMKTTFSKDTYPIISKWREIGDNQFERDITNRVSLNEILEFPAMQLAPAADEVHELRVRMTVKLAKNRIQRVDSTIFVDGHKLATTRSRVVRELPGTIDESNFAIPRICNNREKTSQRKVLALAMFLFGLDSEDKSDMGCMRKKSRDDNVERIGDNNIHNKFAKKDRKKSEEFDESKDNEENEENEENDENTENEENDKNAENEGNEENDKNEGNEEGEVEEKPEESEEENDTEEDLGEKRTHKKEKNSESEDVNEGEVSDSE